MKKILSFILIGIMVLSGINAIAENKLEAPLSENGTLVLRSELAQLEDMGVMKDVGLGACQYITRSEMAKIVTQLLDVPEVYERCEFEDVSAHNPHTGSIDFVAQQKIMNGYSENLFLPDKDITYHEVLKTVVSLLGYEPLAEQKGGYPQGYISVANELGLTMLPAGVDYLLTKEEIAKILLKATDVPLMVQTSYGETVAYEISKDTLKSKYLLESIPEEKENKQNDEEINEKGRLHEKKINSANELIKYGVLNGDLEGNLYLADTLTRAEAVALIVRMNAGYREALTNYESSLYFNNIENHWAEKEILFAFQNGLTDGVDATRFDPERNVAVQEFAKMIILLLGYEETAKKQGEYPHGHMITAHRLGLFDGLYVEGVSDISRGDAAVMLANSFDVPLMRESGFGAEEKYVVMNGEDGSELETLRIIMEKK